MIDTRELALYVMLEVAEKGGYSHLVLRDVMEKYQYLEKRDRAFLGRLCDGTLEQMLRIDEILNRFSSVKTKKMKPVITNPKIKNWMRPTRVNRVVSALLSLVVATILFTRGTNTPETALASTRYMELSCPATP